MTESIPDTGAAVGAAATPPVGEVRPPTAGRVPYATTGMLGRFADAGVLDAADVHVATTLIRLGGVDSARPGPRSVDEPVAPDGPLGLAIALAVRAVRLGSVHVDLATIADTVGIEDAVVDVGRLPWPDPRSWVDVVRASPLTAVGDDFGSSGRDAPGRGRPLRLIDTELSLDRYWRHERSIAADLLQRLVTSPPVAVDGAVMADGLRRLFPPPPTDGDDPQRTAAATAIGGSFAVIAGGPGTGKTTTVAGVLGLLYEQAIAAGRVLPRVALAAPTGKAAARLTEAVHARAQELLTDGAADAAVTDALVAIEASTLHRLLGRNPGSSSRFHHDRSNQLPHEVVIVDESSMVSLSLMARLLEAVRPSARLVLVGDPRQLASVEAGAVLGDIVGPAATATSALAERIVVLDRVHRFAGGVGEVARAIEAGDADATLDLLANPPDGLRWIPLDDTGPAPTADGGRLTLDRAALDAATQVRDDVVSVARAVVGAARAGDADRALAAMTDVQILCAHRRGPAGVAAWRRTVERWLTEDIDAYSPHGWFAGRPVLVTANDYSLDLFNGDAGVAIRAGDLPDGGDRLECAFARRGGVITVSPSRLRAVETMYAMTIHKSQGSQFGHVIVVLPPADSPILTRELLYTAVTRAERQVTVVGSPASITAAIERPVQRASGLRRRLWRAD